MNALNFDLLLRLLVAHFLSDFILQPTSWAKKKDEQGVKSRCFWLHIAFTTLTTAILLWDWCLWSVLLWVVVSHLIFDAFKRKLPFSDLWIFLVDQFAHLLIIVIVWICYTHQSQLLYNTVCEVFSGKSFWCLFLSYLLLSIPASVLIGKMTQKWSLELVEPGNANKGLEDAGKWIGIMERFLVFTFILVNQFGAIGFLLAAKSVFRFGDLKNITDHKKTEYIIIGTFLSFSISIAVGLSFHFGLKR